MPLANVHWITINIQNHLLVIFEIRVRLDDMFAPWNNDILNELKDYESRSHCKVKKAGHTSFMVFKVL